MKSFNIRLAVFGGGVLLLLLLAAPAFSQGQDTGQPSNKNDIVEFFSNGFGKWIVIGIGFLICKAGGAFGGNAKK